ncbi:hypothetical protein [Acinetobacter sp.]|jgi:hypothetical protein|uniref:hypothetical protein n=1 Tax=Acinetobacter sp. TaxID=472 RepID=UPI00281E1EEF|nr:hypothetical protein [Acinetobacter sp.]MDR0235268.1 hypothetical protein [Acinetobacter sp.]
MTVAPYSIIYCRSINSEEINNAIKLSFERVDFKNQEKITYNISKSDHVNYVFRVLFFYENYPLIFDDTFIRDNSEFLNDFFYNSEICFGFINFIKERKIISGYSIYVCSNDYFSNIIYKIFHNKKINSFDLNDYVFSERLKNIKNIEYSTWLKHNFNQ